MSELLKELRSNDPETSWSAARKLGEAGDEDAAPELVRQLGIEDKNYSLMAVSVQYPEESDARIGAYATALVKIGDTSVVPDLIELLEDGGAWIVWETAYVLEALEARDAVPALIDALTRLRDTAGRYKFEFMIRSDVAGSILRLADESAIPALKDVLKDESDGRMISLLTSGISELDEAQLRDERLVEALAEGSLPERVFALEMISRRRKESLLENTGEIRDGLLGIVDSDCAPHYRRSAVHLLGELQASEAIPELLERLDTRRLRSSILEAVEEIPGGLELLANAMDVDDDEVSLSAAVRIGQEGDHRAIPFLKRALRGGEARDRLEAANALASLGERGAAIEILVDLLERPSAELYHQWAVRALGELQAEEAVPTLLSAGEGGSPSVELEAARALCRLGEEEAATEILARRSHITMWRSEVVDVIRAFTPRAAIPLLLECLTKIDRYHLDSPGGPAEFHREVVDALKAYPSYPEMLVEALEHDEDELRFWAAIHLGREGDDGAVPVLAEALESERDNVRLAAAKSLYVLEEHEPADAAVAQMLQSDAGERLEKKAIATIVEFDRTRFIPELERIVDDGDVRGGLRLDAAVALYRLGEREVSVSTLERFLESAGHFFLTDVLEALRETEAESLVPAVRDAAECWYEPAKVEAVRTLAHFSASDAVLELASEILAESYRKVGTKTDVIEALGTVRSEEVTSLLKETVEDPDWHIQLASARALYLSGEREIALAPFLEIIRSSGALRWKAIEALEELKATDAIPDLEKLAEEEEDPGTRADVERAIQRLAAETRPTSRT